MVAIAGYQLELTADSLQYRRLDSGVISWKDSTPNTCNQPGYLLSASRTVSLGQRDDRTVNEPTSLTTYPLASGEQLWQRQGVQPIHSLTSVDDRGVLALTQGEQTCDVQVRRASGVRTLLTMPDDSGHSGSRGVRCCDSSVLRVGDTYLLNLEPAPDMTSGSIPDYPVHRFVGLA